MRQCRSEPAMACCIVIVLGLVLLSIFHTASLRTILAPSNLGHLEGPPCSWPGTNSTTAIITLLTDKPFEYGQGALRLIRSIQAKGGVPGVDMVLLELAEKPLPAEMRKLLVSAGWNTCVIPRIPPSFDDWIPEPFIDQYSKLHIWRMVQYQRVLYLDSDCLVTGSLKPLMNLSLEHKIWAGRDFRNGIWVSGFNMGVFMIRPDVTEFARLLELKQDPASTYEFKMAEQGFLNAVYSGQWAELDFVYNANLAVYLQDPSTWARFKDKIRVVHFTMSKPWSCDWKLYEPLCFAWTFG